jgi:hypothetical protein
MTTNEASQLIADVHLMHAAVATFGLLLEEIDADGRDIEGFACLLEQASIAAKRASVTVLDLEDPVSAGAAAEPDRRPSRGTRTRPRPR